MVATITPEKKAGDSIFAGVDRVLVSKMTHPEFSDACDSFIENTDLEEDTMNDLARLMIRQTFASHYTKTQESIYNYNFALRYAIDPGYSFEDLQKDLTSRHSLSSSLQNINAVYHIVKSPTLKSRLAEVITLLKVLVAEKEKKA